ncbi:receptor-like serine/threonine-protein kinase SD1-8 isoform X3 [Canna indica]|uniref:Receptor-like serine/threonine-protein kinase n=1 Tax=Canna indica TaxID=4628 RepID=A0AAQ3KH54_9LILI|nr:receptor-like serine/threonine-protein kinase SD1-8 isoform X3 [Canna indica]
MEVSALIFLLLLLLLLLAATLFAPSSAHDTMAPTQHLADDGEILISFGSNFALGFFCRPNKPNNRYIGIWYHKIKVQTVVWVANRRRPVAGRFGRLSLTANGTLVIAENSTVIWSMSSTALANPIARLLDNGNFVVDEANDSSNEFAWESFDFPTDTILPGMKFGWSLARGINRNLTAWSSNDDPSPGKFVTSLDLRGDPQLILWAGERQHWRGGPWNGLRFSGIPQMKLDMTGYNFVVDSDEVCWSYYLRNPSVISRVTTTHAGVVQHVVWVEAVKSWKVVGFTPRDECDGVSPCGPYGVCYPNREPMCACTPGFRPRNSENWYLSDWAEGCVRNTALDCGNRSGDGFMTQSSMKLPDMSGSTVYWSMSLQRCRALCLKNCSCTAYASANISEGGSGCIMWTTELTDMRWYDSDLGQDLYVRLAASDLGAPHSQWSLIVVIILVFLETSIVVVFCKVWRRKKKRNPYINIDKQEITDMALPLYDLATIRHATDNFSLDNKLGQGGFGPVYKGYLREEGEVAVKRLSETSSQGLDEFKNEALLIAKLQHRNLVRLLGCCIQGGERMLIYEYMPNGSLDSFLFDEMKKLLLDWPTRYSIVIGISRSLLYLHQDSRFRIIHWDIKAGNVLLDKDMKPKISDFGMARIFGGEEAHANTRRVVGTYGYMSPEYAMDENFSVKSDVFSFGVLILEIITGRKNRGVYECALHVNLLGHAWSLWEEGRILELVDISMGHSFPVAEVLSCIKVGLLCVHEQAIDRPTMSSVVRMLGDEITLLPEPTRPGFVAPRNSSRRRIHFSVNNMSMTKLEGR